MATSPVAVNAVVSSGDQLVNGKTYTFVFQCTNLLSNPSPAQMAADLDATAPDFIQSVNIQQEQGANSNYFNVVFTYEGDGSDVASDVVTSMVAAWGNGTSGSFVFTVGFGSAIPTYSVTSGGNSAGVSYSFSPLNLLLPVTPGQQAAYQSEAAAQVAAVGTSPGGQVAAAQPTGAAFTSAVASNAAQATQDVATASAAANASSTTGTILSSPNLLAGVLGGSGFLLLAAAAAVAYFVFFMPAKRATA